MITFATRRRPLPAITLCAALCLGALSCQGSSEPQVVLTQQQWREVEKQILKEAPTPEHVLEVNYDNEIELIGLDVEPKTLQAGEPATFTWYWRALKAPTKNWQIFVHFDSREAKMRQGLDHHPVKGLLKTSLWKPGQIIKDVQTVTIREDFPSGTAVPYIGLYHGDGTEARMKIVNDAEKTNDRRAIGPAIPIQGASASNQKGATEEAVALPSYRATRLSAEEVALITIDGKLEETVWEKAPKIKLEPFGEGQELETWAKVAYSDEALYVIAYLEDRHIWGDLKERDSKTWEQEVFELFIDPDGDSEDYLELQVTPQNVVFDANFKKRLGAQGEGSSEEQIARASAWNFEGMETAVFIDGTPNDLEKEDRFWSVEMRLPFASFPGLEGKPPADGTSWSMNLYRFDRPAIKQSFAYAWSRQTRNSFHDVPRFGTLQFGAPRMRPGSGRLNLNLPGRSRLGSSKLEPDTLRRALKQQGTQPIEKPMNIHPIKRKRDVEVAPVQPKP